MSRTRRNLNHINDTGTRIVRFRNTLMAEQSAMDALSDYGFTPSVRLTTRASRLTHPNDDQFIAGLFETYKQPKS